MPIDKLLSANRVLAQAECTSKKRILETLAELITGSLEYLSAEDLFQQFIARERLGSTGLGGSIAIPHCRFNTGGTSVCAVVTLQKAIDFEAVDGEPVDLFFAMVVPEDAEDDHLKNLAALAEALQQQNYPATLRSADSNSVLYQAAIAPFKTEATAQSAQPET